MQPALSPCLRYAACGSEDRQAYLYDVGSARLVQKLGGHSDAVTAVAFNPYHPQLASTGLDGTVRFYSDRGDRD
jgi:WD40 repeat protein